MMTPGTPIPYQKPINGSIEKAFEQGNVQADVKYNGHRMQIHVTRGEIILYSKSFDTLNPACFPEITHELKKYKEAIFDAEIVGLSGGAEGLKAIQSRPKKNPDQKKMKKYPLQLRVFDMLYWKGSLIEKPLEKRRAILEEVVCGKNILPAETTRITTGEELAAYYHHIVDVQKEEGLVAKNPMTSYESGKESKNWMKLKKYETLDLVIAGFYRGKGKEAAAPFAGVLLCTYNVKTGLYETMVKVTITGRLRNELAAQLLPHMQQSPPESVVFNPKLWQEKKYSQKIPSIYIDPKRSLVVTIKGMDISYSNNWHSCGGLQQAYSLLLPVITHIRDPTDKKPQDATTTRQITELYKEQMRNG